MRKLGEGTKGVGDIKAETDELSNRPRLGLGLVFIKRAGLKLPCFFI
jgi:hypothetical protein